MRQGETVDGKYALRDPLGRGSFGEVWAAENLIIGRRVALKFLAPIGRMVEDSELQARFLREAKLVASLRHRHIVNVFDLGVHGNSPYLVMDLVDGQSLGDELRAHEPGRFPIERAVLVARQIAEALRYAYDGEGGRPIIHRDIKPDNVLVDRSGDVIVCDFGLAVAIGGTRLTQGGTLGTPSYMAPEQIRGDAEHRSDMYSLGCLLYELLTGRPPFTGPNPYSIADAQLHAEPRPANELRTDLPPYLNGLIGRLLAKDPRDRPDAAAFLTLLEPPQPGSVEARAPASDRPREVTATLETPAPAGSAAPDGTPEQAARVRRFTGWKVTGIMLGAAYCSWAVATGHDTLLVPGRVGPLPYLGVFAAAAVLPFVLLMFGIGAGPRRRSLVTQALLAGPVGLWSLESLWRGADAWYLALGPSTLASMWLVMIITLHFTDT